ADDTDCDDDDPLVHPDADERCDEVDNDCDGDVDEPDAVDAPTWYVDADNDRFGDGTTGVPSCARVPGTVRDGTDCDDANPAIRPTAPEQCNGIDDDCDGEADDAITYVDWWPDLDGDGFGDDGATPVNDCVAPANTI